MDELIIEFIKDQLHNGDKDVNIHPDLVQYV